MSLLLGALLFSILFATCVFFVAWNDRNIQGRLNLCAQLVLLFAISIPVSWAMFLWELRLKWLYLLRTDFMKPFISLVFSAPELAVKCFVISNTVFIFLRGLKKLVNKWILMICCIIPLSY